MVKVGSRRGVECSEGVALVWVVIPESQSQFSAASRTSKRDGHDATQAGKLAQGFPVLLFDGECGLCNAVVRFLLRRDPEGRLRFATLQGEFGQATLRRLGLPTDDFDSLVFLPRGDGNAFRLKTDGVLAVLACLSGGWSKLPAWVGWMPRGLRDAAYTVVARTRYALFGQYRPRPFARPEWAERFVETADVQRITRAPDER